MVMTLRIVSDQDSAIRGTLASALVALARPKLTPGGYLAARGRGGAIISAEKRTSAAKSPLDPRHRR
jgi:hypothetical protein